MLQVIGVGTPVPVPTVRLWTVQSFLSINNSPFKRIALKEIPPPLGCVNAIDVTLLTFSGPNHWKLGQAALPIGNTVPSEQVATAVVPPAP